MTTFQPHRTVEPMIEVEEAQRRVLEQVSLIGTEQVPIDEAHGRVLREDVVAPGDLPQADNSAMDGYAVRVADLSPGAVLRVIEDLPAGEVSRREVEQGTAIRIMTGATIPSGADAVVPVELTDGGSDAVRIERAVKLGANIRRRGEDMRAGAIVLPSGAQIGPAEMGVLAGTQRRVVMVARRPAVAILSTGDEVIDIDQQLVPGKVINSNSWSLAALARETGAVPRAMGIVPDDRAATIAAIEEALDADIVISSGGVSVGAYDFVKDALDALGGETKFWNVAMKPGKPVILSRVGDRLYFGLPGNPVSCMVAFILFVAPAIRKSMGSADVFPPTVSMRLAEDLASRGDRRSYQRVRAVADEGELVAHPKPAQGSGVSTSMVGANGFAIVPAGVTRIAAGERVEVVLFDRVTPARH